MKLSLSTDLLGDGVDVVAVERQSYSLPPRRLEENKLKAAARTRRSRWTASRRMATLAVCRATDDCCTAMQYAAEGRLRVDCGVQTFGASPCVEPHLFDGGGFPSAEGPKGNGENGCGGAFCVILFVCASFFYVRPGGRQRARCLRFVGSDRSPQIRHSGLGPRPRCLGRVRGQLDRRERRRRHRSTNASKCPQRAQWRAIPSALQRSKAWSASEPKSSPPVRLEFRRTSEQGQGEVATGQRRRRRRAMPKPSSCRKSRRWSRSFPERRSECRRVHAAGDRMAMLQCLCFLN